MLKDRTAIQVDVDCLEEWVNGNLMKFDMEICKVLCLGWKDPLQQHRQSWWAVGGTWANSEF